jgi:hypothetical protein
MAAQTDGSHCRFTLRIVAAAASARVRARRRRDQPLEQSTARVIRLNDVSMFVRSCCTRVRNAAS